VPHIRERSSTARAADVPLVGRLPLQRPQAAAEFPGLRRGARPSTASIPGNVGKGASATAVRAMIEIACRHDKPVRIGVNWGSSTRNCWRG
jgi:(E)-4-hydroxy-3-methylbut-2-enyl-diphosphate synthase